MKKKTPAEKWIDHWVQKSQPVSEAAKKRLFRGMSQSKLDRAVAHLRTSKE